MPADPSRPSALITGASRGIGAAAARLLSDTHDVWLGGRDEAALAALVSRLPPSWRLIAASRMNLAVDLSRLRVSGEVVDIGPDELRFRTWEVEELFRDVYQEPLLPEDVAALTRRTAGLLQPPPNTQGPKPTMRRSTFKEVRRAVA